MEVGDIVVLKNELRGDRCYDGCRFAPEMNKYKNKILVIENNTITNRWKCSVNGRFIFDWVFASAMLQKVITNKKE